MGLSDQFSGALFKLVHRCNLVYNQCWEDPRLDRQALKLNQNSVVMCITSAGCNILDYLLDEPQHIYAVDMNPRQNHLLELKCAGIRKLDFKNFFDIFGYGRSDVIETLYRNKLRPELSDEAKKYWDKNWTYFGGKGWRSSFYFHGTSGLFARLINSYINGMPGTRNQINSILNASCTAQQSKIYNDDLSKSFWKGFVPWLMNRSAILSLLGVPKAQRLVLEQKYNGRVGHFVKERVDHVFSKMPMVDNYFWRVYLTGSYTKDCCPEYLKEANFNRLKAGLVDRVSLHSQSIEEFLSSKDRTQPISHYVLLDHMDWLATRDGDVLKREWQAIADASTSEGARIIWRSASSDADFVNPITINIGEKSSRVGDLLRYSTSWAESLHSQCRVSTYGSFYIADLALS